MADFPKIGSPSFLSFCPSLRSFPPETLTTGLRGLSARQQKGRDVRIKIIHSARTSTNTNQNPPLVPLVFTGVKRYNGTCRMQLIAVVYGGPISVDRGRGVAAPRSHLHFLFVPCLYYTRFLWKKQPPNPTNSPLFLPWRRGCFQNSFRVFVQFAKSLIFLPSGFISGHDNPV